ncbi:hypothetical protein D910_06202 [Dendroctonus ponderosae]
MKKYIFLRLTFSGICVKSKEVGTDVKVFVNICTTDAIPPPKNISESELQEYIDSDDSSEFRVPMSIGEVRTEQDKKGTDVKVVDIAINPGFFTKLQSQKLFNEFFMTVVFQGVLSSKYGLQCVDNKIVLNNRKAFGTLQVHRIQQREIDEKMGIEKPLLPEVIGENGPKKVAIETISSDDISTKQPEHRLYKKKVSPNCLIGEFKLPEVIAVKDIHLDVGEDRIVLECSERGYFLDVFVPFCIRVEKCTSSFDKALKILTVVMPLIGG